MLLAKPKLNTIEVLVFKAFIDSYINHGEFVSESNELREYNEMKLKIKDPENIMEYATWYIVHTECCGRFPNWL